MCRPYNTSFLWYYDWKIHIGYTFCVRDLRSSASSPLCVNITPFWLFQDDRNFQGQRSDNTIVQQM